jgi:hypothetical protein
MGFVVNTLIQYHANQMSYTERYEAIQDLLIALYNDMDEVNTPALTDLRACVDEASNAMTRTQIFLEDQLNAAEGEQLA